jgi:hypothetical protein
MSAVASFKLRSRIDADAKVEAFILNARNGLAAFGADIDFDSDCWDITSHSFAKGDRRVRAGRVHLFFDKVPDGKRAGPAYNLRMFAKAYVRSQTAHLSASVVLRAVKAFEALGAAMEKIGIDFLADCDAACFDAAVSYLVADGTALTTDATGPRLGQIARFLDRNMLCIHPIGRWRYIKQRRSQSGRVGDAFEARRRRSLPDPEAIDALAQAFRLASDPRDVLATSVAAILCSAPERINELLNLSANCEVTQIGDDGREYLGLRWAGSKGYADHVKLILPGMTDVVREALRKILAITDQARRIARWYEEYPTQLYLPEDQVHLRDREFVEFEEIGTLVGLSGTARSTVRGWVKAAGIPVTLILRQSGHLAHVIRFADLEKHIVGLLPSGFPVADSRTGLNYTDALTVIPHGLFRNGSASLCMIEPLRYHHISYALGQNGSAGSVTVFQRVGLDPDRRLCLRSHEFRHWLNTLAQGANLSQLDIAKWSGRRNVEQNAFYDHVTSEEIVAQIRAKVGDHAKAVGPLAEVPKKLPVSREEYAAMAVPTAHTTLYGFCIHDFAASPCEMFRNCLDCREHVCIKGLSDRTERIERSLALASSHLEQAQAAVADGVYGAEDWVNIHQANVERLRQLIAILNDPDIEDGALIQLTDRGSYTLSEGVAYDHLAGIEPFDRVRSSQLRIIPPDTEPSS